MSNNPAEHSSQKQETEQTPAGNPAAESDVPSSAPSPDSSGDAGTEGTPDSSGDAQSDASSSGSDDAQAAARRNIQIGRRATGGSKPSLAAATGSAPSTAASGEDPAAGAGDQATTETASPTPANAEVSTPNPAQPGADAQPTGDQAAATVDDANRSMAIEVPKGPIPKPSRRDPLSDDLQKELDAALGNASLDDLISGEAASAAGHELELESRHHATVLKVDKENVFFKLDGRNEGAAPIRQFEDNVPSEGERLDVIVAGFNSDEGLYEVKVPGASVDVQDWSDLSEGSVVEARVTGSNTGGLECMVNNIRGFIPASQISLYRVDNMVEFLDQKLLCVVSEADPNRKNLVLSRRAVLEREKEEARKALMEELEVGQVREGIVRSLRDFGAFVDIGGVDGLVHISQLSWDRVNHPSDVLEEGQKVRVRVEKIDKEKSKIGLSYRDLLEDPWEDVETKFSVGSVVTGKVTRIAKFGAFVRLGSGIEGLIHISELAHYRVSQVGSIVQEGQELEVKILSVDKESQRIGLSLKATQQAPEKAKSKAEQEAEDETPREMAVPKRQGPLKGGVDRPSGGEGLGLNW